MCLVCLFRGAWRAHHRCPSHCTMVVSESEHEHSRQRRQCLWYLAPSTSTASAAYAVLSHAGHLDDTLTPPNLPVSAFTDGAVAAGVARHRDIFASRGAMTTEKEVGLLGELLFLEFLIHQIGAGPAISAWQGPLSEEHDFTFDSVHVEVKSTSSERRRHIINGLDQLVPLRGVPLSLLSIQFTRTSPTGGRTRGPPRSGPLTDR